MPTQAYVVAPASTPWQFTGIAGVSSNSSAFTAGDPNAPNGAQVAFIQDNASISQTVTLDAGVYNLSMLAAQRINYQTQQQAIEVLIDGAEVGLIVPNSPVTANNVTYTTYYATYQTSNFTVTAGTHTVELLGTESGQRRQHGIHRRSGDHAGGRHDPAMEVSRSRPWPPMPSQTDPGGSAWQFSGTAGIARNGSDFVTNWTEAQNAPAGTQVGYLRGRRQHEPDRVPGRRHLPTLVPGCPA